MWRYPNPKVSKQTGRKFKKKILETSFKFMDKYKQNHPNYTVYEETIKRSSKSHETVPLITVLHDSGV
jgi:hypothetical protein